MHSEIAVSHKKIHVQESDRNLRIYEKQLTNEGVLSPRDMFYFARELYYHYQYERAAKFFQEFLDSQKGWIENNIEACRFMALCLYKLDRCDDALEALLKSLQYDIPRAEVCCDIGRHFFDRNIYNVAIFWYKTALSSERNDKSGAFVMTECYGYIPAIQLCVCYDHIGDKEAARHYNEIAGKYNPLSTAYLKNKEYFESLNT